MASWVCRFFFVVSLQRVVSLVFFSSKLARAGFVVCGLLCFSRRMSRVRELYERFILTLDIKIGICCTVGTVTIGCRNADA
ncbi:hypothetical protein BD289DRAFT_271440 [Coniella lustricola]|uniref:Uncharacterized protein n=1 Tax=Coniella lustricola TaxID=2025994 RepID=A0A2T3AKH1_9PEZI|nr:hypothetical protein BD289DRAFT_271440 [Coniella lustricola]